MFRIAQIKQLSSQQGEKKPQRNLAYLSRDCIILQTWDHKLYCNISIDQWKERKKKQTPQTLHG